MKLYEISADYLEIINAIESGEIPDDQAVDLIEQMEGEWQTKAEAVGSYLLNLRAEINAIYAAAKRMVDRAERTEKRADRLAEYLQWQMQRVGKREIKTPEWTAKLRKSPPSVAIVDEWEIPAGYWREKTTRSVDKALIREAMKDGHDVPGVKIEQSEKLRIG